MLLGVISAGVVASGCSNRRSGTPDDETRSDQSKPRETYHGASTGESVDLVVGGEAQFEPTVADEAVPSATRNEFIHYAEVSTDIDFTQEAAYSLRFEIGSFESVRKAVREEAFELCLSNQDLVVRGGGPRGVLYGTYELLERAFGIRWLAPGPDGTVIPDEPSLTVLVNDGIHAPDFAARVAGAFHSEEYLLWAIRNRLQPTYWPAVSDAAFTHTSTEPVGETRGGYVASTNIHSFYDLLPPSKYREKHPEWYSENQLDLRNAAVRDALVERCRRFFNTNPNVDHVAVTPEDGYGWPPRFASDSQIRAQRDAGQPARLKHHRNISEPFFRAISAIANRLKKTHPDKRLYTSAYLNYVWPPVTLQGVPDNVTVAVAHYNPADYAHPIGSTATEASERFETVLQRWTERAEAPWLYAYTVKYALDCLPFPIANRLATDIETIFQLGYDGFYSQGGEGRWGQYGPHFYVMARKLWNVDISADEVLDQYFDGMFGRGSPPVRSAYDRLWNALQNADHAVDRHPLTELRPVFTDGLIESVVSSLDTAVSATTTPRTRRNVRAMRLGAAYTKHYFAFRQAIVDHEEGDRTSLRRVVDAYNDIAELVDLGEEWDLDALPRSLVDPDGYFSLHGYAAHLGEEVDTTGPRWTVS